MLINSKDRYSNNLASRFLSATLLLIIALIVFTCKDSGKTLDKKYEDKLVVEMVMKIPKSDKFELYYRGKDEKFDSKKRIQADVIGSEELQKAEFIFDILEFPTHIRIVFGQNKEQAEMRLDHLAFRYNDGVHTFTEEEMKKFFRANSGLKIDFEDKSVRTATVDGKYVPYLNSFDISYFVNKLILY